MDEESFVGEWMILEGSEEPDRKTGVGWTRLEELLRCCLMFFFVSREIPRWLQSGHRTVLWLEHGVGCGWYFSGYEGRRCLLSTALFLYGLSEESQYLYSILMAIRYL